MRPTTGDFRRSKIDRTSFYTGTGRITQTQKLLRGLDERKSIVAGCMPKKTGRETSVSLPAFENDERLR
jgi:hypothetical protein